MPMKQQVSYIHMGRATKSAACFRDKTEKNPIMRKKLYLNCRF